MLTKPRVKFRFSLLSVFVLVLGIAIGFTVKTMSLWRWSSTPNAAHMMSLPTYVIEPPDILTIEMHSKSANGPPAAPAQHLVGPDGMVNLGIYGQVYVSGLTLDQARAAVESQLSKYLDTPQAIINVFAYSSKSYYVIMRSGATGDAVTKYPITGNETALDGLAQFGGLKGASTAKIWIARPAPNGVGSEAILPINFDRIARGISDTNYQLLPGDRLYISQDGAAATAN